MSTFHHPLWLRETHEPQAKDQPQAEDEDERSEYFSSTLRLGSSAVSMGRSELRRDLSGEAKGPLVQSMQDSLSDGLAS